VIGPCGKLTNFQTKLGFSAEGNLSLESQADAWSQGRGRKTGWSQGQKAIEDLQLLPGAKDHQNLKSAWYLWGKGNPRKFVSVAKDYLVLRPGANNNLNRLCAV
jgi:hypothetical protein